jgi:UDPglucose 6-dehydrogenase
MHLVFIGTGYVGLVSGVMMASKGHNVICVDSNQSKIDALKEGQVPIYEPGLEEYILDAKSKKKLKFVSSYSDVDFHPDAVFICVGTPQKETGEANLDYVFTASLEVAKNFKNVPIIVKSTVPPGTCDALLLRLEKEGYKNPVLSNPEFLSEGRAIEDFLYPDRIIVGTEEEESKYLMGLIYESFIKENYPVVFSSRVSAELVKYASNSFLATKIEMKWQIYARKLVPI